MSHSRETSATCNHCLAVLKIHSFKELRKTSPVQRPSGKSNSLPWLLCPSFPNLTPVQLYWRGCSGGGEASLAPKASGPVCNSDHANEHHVPLKHCTRCADSPPYTAPGALPSSCQHSASPHRFWGLFYRSPTILPAAEGLRIMPRVAEMRFPCVALLQPQVSAVSAGREMLERPLWLLATASRLQD